MEGLRDSVVAEVARSSSARRRPSTGSCAPCSSAGTSCSRACPASRRRSSRTRSPARSGSSSAASSSRRTCSRRICRDDDAARRRARVPAGPGLHERAARRRDQPDAAEDPGGPARGDGGAAGHDRGVAAGAARAVPRARDPEPDRVRGHVPAARGAARPLPVQARRSATRTRRRSGRSSGCGSAACGRRLSSDVQPVVDPAELRAGAPGARRDRRLRRGGRVHRRGRARDADAAERRARREPARRRPSACRREGASRGSTSAATSRPTTSRTSPRPCSATGCCCGPRPSSSGIGPTTRCAPRSTRFPCPGDADAARRGRVAPVSVVAARPAGRRSRCSSRCALAAAAVDAWRAAAAARSSARCRRASRARRPARAAPRCRRTPAGSASGSRVPPDLDARAGAGGGGSSGDARRPAPRPAHAAGAGGAARPGRSGSARGRIASGEPAELARLPRPAGVHAGSRRRPRGQVPGRGLARRGPLGLGTEFESVRDYSPDDDIRQVNWRATARLGRPMSNQYRIERDRDVVCVVDCGRLMAAPFADSHAPRRRARRRRRGRGRRRRARRPLRRDRVRRRRAAFAAAAAGAARASRDGAVRSRARAGRERLRARVRPGSRRQARVRPRAHRSAGGGGGAAARRGAAGARAAARRGGGRRGRSRSRRGRRATEPHVAIDVYRAAVALDVLAARARAAARLRRAGATVDRGAAGDARRRVRQGVSASEVGWLASSCARARGRAPRRRCRGRRRCRSPRRGRTRQIGAVPLDDPRDHEPRRRPEHEEQRLPRLSLERSAASAEAGGDDRPAEAQARPRRRSGCRTARGLRARSTRSTNPTPLPACPIEAADTPTSRPL